MAKLPTPPTPAWIKTLSPLLIFAESTRLCQDVIPTSGIEAASSKESRSGFFATYLSSTATYSAYVPFLLTSGLVNTLSPTVNFVTRSEERRGGKERRYQ